MGVAVLLGPGINLKRSPLGGRNFEYFSEDPLLAGVLATEWVNGLQSRNVGASLKHFAVNNQETDRLRVSADVDERTLREMYLRAFHRVITRARPWTVMCAYNKINGVYASQDHWLLTEVLRDEWGYEGVVVSDWGAVADRVAAVAAGLDLTMPGPDPAGDQELVDAVADGRLDAALLARNAGRVSALVAQGRGPHPGRLRRGGAPRARPRDRRARHRAAQERRPPRKQAGHPAARPGRHPVHRRHRRVRPHPALPGRRQLADHPDPARRRAHRDHRHGAGDGALRARLPDQRAPPRRRAAAGDGETEAEADQGPARRGRGAGRGERRRAGLRRQHARDRGRRPGRHRPARGAPGADRGGGGGQPAHRGDPVQRRGARHRRAGTPRCPR